MSLTDRLMERLQRRRLAYLNTLCDGANKPHPNAVIMLRDLKRFCGINKGGIVVSPISRMVDSHATAYRAGMRDVYLRIAGMIKLNETDIGEDDDRSSSE